MYTPRTSSYIENAWPLLRDFGYSREEIAQVVKDSEYDDNLINERISEMALDGAEGRGWKKVGQKPIKPAGGSQQQSQNQSSRGGKKPLPKKNASERRGHERFNPDNTQASRSNQGRPDDKPRPQNTERPSQPASDLRRSERKPQREEAGETTSNQTVKEAVGTETQNRRAGTWAARLKPAVKKLDLKTVTDGDAPPPKSPEPSSIERSTEVAKAKPKAETKARSANTWAARVRGIKNTDQEAKEDSAETANMEKPQSSAEAVPEVEQAATENVSVAPPPISSPLDLTTMEAETVKEKPSTDHIAQTLAAESYVAPSPPAASEHRVHESQIPQPAVRSLNRMYEQYATPPPLYPYQHPYPVAFSYCEYDMNRLQAAQAPSAYNEMYMGYPRVVPAPGRTASTDESGYDQRTAAVSGAPYTNANEGYPYYYAPYDQRRYEYAAVDASQQAAHTQAQVQQPAAPQTGAPSARDYRDYTRTVGEQAQFVPQQMRHQTQQSQSTYPRPDPFRREAYYGIPPLYMTMAHQEQPSGQATSNQYTHQQYHYPYTGAGYYPTFGANDRRSRY